MIDYNKLTVLVVDYDLSQLSNKFIDRINIARFHGEGDYILVYCKNTFDDNAPEAFNIPEVDVQLIKLVVLTDEFPNNMALKKENIISKGKEISVDIDLERIHMINGLNYFIDKALRK